MRCKKHQFDCSSSIGVCASCLRERLFLIIAAQAQAEKQSEIRAAVSGDNRAAEDRPLPPPPLVFLRSVSPYDHRLKSDEGLLSDLDREGNRRNRHQRFYSTPQIGPDYRTNNTANSTFVTTGSFDRKKRSKFSLWSKLFKSRSEKFEKKHKSPSHESHASDSASLSPSWFSTILNGRRIKQQSSLATVEESIAGAERRHHCQTNKRGMSPAIISESDEEECESHGRSPISQKFQQSPMTIPGSAKREKLGHKQNVSGFAFCLSPLVRASPNRNWNQKVMPPEVSFSGNLRVPGKPHLCANRSRKIADFGRVNHNR
ncbi:uncharacterized protein LOC111799804 isoform X2 [Cucurbita pepo subsp. pepo]|uniref:uncharacterized protein LOC111799804 isoform X2 n=1 Tax=Cucurbita pepo subsp. pepo TaxID=3664 RepID=UPI000C9D8D7E|nr:uncharacterized protein LOC111799804 isoform X2 [Cucurbita pepo subsp. pepo]